ncbi:MAG: serine/threonine protein kinase [Gemmatimonadetes bacterium]|nr:serine/threonine protein kinase [Gemmatimonadota bacterium]
MSPLSNKAMLRLRETLDFPELGPRYDVRELVGRGGMGSVFRVFDDVLAREVAVKVLSIEAESSVAAGMLTAEARALAALDHAGIVAVHDAGTLDDGRPYYVMRFVRGARLGVWARTATLRDLLRAFTQVCDAVASAHARGVIHRDLTPSNIMVGEYGEVVVLDWGLAVRASEPGGRVPAGTPGFQAPEQVVGEPSAIDARTDVFGLGAVLVALLAGQSVPVPRPVRAITARATAMDPAARYQSVVALADDVRRWMDAEPVSAYREPVFERIGRLYQRHQVVVLLLVAYVGVRLLMFWLQRR